MAPAMPWPNCSKPSNCQPDDALIVVSTKSKPSPSRGPRICGISDALSVVGDRWALLVLRELDSGVHRFNDIHTNTGAPRDRLATRLRELEGAGLITRRRYSERPPRDEYVLTGAGSAIGPVLRELRIWGETYAR
jgi:DNA-binding HxlR family transcriptional regulator